jgi:hypothetical protein
MDRLQRFRAAIKNIGSTAAEAGVSDELLVVDEGFMRGPDIASRLTLDPKARVLIVGGIGTGKSTQLEWAARRLEESATVLRISEDLSQSATEYSRPHGWNQPVAAGFSAALCMALLGHIVGGRTEFKSISSSDRLAAQTAFEKPGAGSSADKIDTATSILRGANQHGDVVIVIDGQDRMSARTFSELIAALGHIVETTDCGVIAIGPPDLPFGSGAQAHESIPTFVFVDPLPVDRDAAARRVLVNILQRRLADHVQVGPEALSSIALLSSGVIRDALQLLKLSLNHAFSVGADTVSLRSVQIAHEEFVRSKLFGLEPAPLSMLQNVTKEGLWMLSGNVERELFRRGLLVAQYDAEKRLSFVVHAAIAPMLPRIAA